MSAVLKAPKQKKCKVCCSSYTPINGRLQRVCFDVTCAAEYARRQTAKRLKREKREGRIKLRSVSDWTKLAQAEFNRFVRMRDDGLPCISCGAINPPQLHGGAWDCGHFRSVGAAPELRFEELNAARQCKSCNGGRFRDGAYTVPLERQMTVHAHFRLGLIKRIGLEGVEWLEGPHEPKRYRIEELIEIRDKYLAKCNELKKAREA